MFVKDNFVVLMFTLKIGEQGIPIWFRCEKHKSKITSKNYEKQKKKIFDEKYIMNAVKEVINIFNKHDIKITFLADRWFCNLKLMKFIQDNGHYFCIRAKVNSNIKVKIYDRKEKHEIYTTLAYFHTQKHHSLYYENLEIGTFGFRCNLSIARNKLSDDPWFILSNIEPNKALREYSHRFGSIESVFKSQKSNGLNLEKTKTKNIKAFETLYGICCFVVLWLTIIGVDYTKNYHKVKNKLNIKFTKKRKGKLIRIISNFNLGLTILKKVYSSYTTFKLKCNLQLYL